MPSTTLAPGPVPVLDLAPEIDALWGELHEAFDRVLRSGHFIGGPEVIAFEEETASYLGARHAVGLNSGTDALVISLRALGIGPGDEVITTPFSFFATAESISAVGATPVFADVEDSTFNIDPEEVERLVTGKTRALMPVHLFGRPAAMGRLMEIARRHGLKVVEDCAQSFGATLGERQTGTIGDAGTYSFFPSKNLGGFGDGGMLVTDDERVAQEARRLRAHGSLKKYHNETVGYNSRLDALQAALLRVRLPHVDRYNEARREVASRYNELLSGVEGIILPEVTPGHVFHQYTIRVLEGRRDELARLLGEQGIGTMVYYPVPQHRLPVYDLPAGTCPVSERLAEEVLSLPIGTALGNGVPERVAEAIRQALQDSAEH